MKLSIKFQDDPLNEDQNRQIMTAKVPITIFNQPFVSGVVATTTHSVSDFSFSLSTNFPSGPSLKLSYSPTASNTTSIPFSLSLKSGLGISGSPRHSPLVFSARFSLSPSYTPLPSFFLHFKPQFGHFSLNKTVFSDSNSHQISAVPIPSLQKGEFEAAGDSSSAWQELKLEPCGGGKDEGKNTNTNTSLVVKSNGRDGVSSGIAIMARTVMPVTKGLSLNLRWGLNLPGNVGLKMPSLTVNKIGLERVEEVTKNKQSRDDAASEGDLQMLKGMCFWMRRDLEIVEKENREMKRILGEMKMGVSTGNGNVGESSSSEFERWRSKKNGKEGNGQRETNKSQNLASDVESELQKAIKAASS
ncbi:chloroplast 40 kDa outer membrane envelope protein [Senna tora]|uniref:Chloroplast 40 kDa outer membrane envelope protein n=1 Tax=Senna tora TaxID=362788 RepID=A0A834TWH9_9FABA|nr:chloroplast 40 kDa outer membrane envelope protein [Senna tora]